MGQLSPTLSLLTIGLSVIGALMSAFHVNAQAYNCVFLNTENQTENGPSDLIICGDPISEKLDAGEIIWDVGTENVVSSAASQFPHAQYLEGLRYTNRYVYRTSPSFTNFVDAEQVTEVHRNVTYTCEDGGSVKVHFKFPLIDVNDAPEFIGAQPYTFNANIPVPGSDPPPINQDTPIIVKDKDFNPANADVKVTTDRPDLLLIGLEEANSDGLGKTFNIFLNLNMETGNIIKPGQYSLVLFASDGQLTVSSDVSLNLLASEEG